MKRTGHAGVVLAVVFLTIVGIAHAETTTTICVPTKPAKAVVSGENGICKNTKTVTYNPVVLPGSGGLETLNQLLPHIAYVESGIGGKPTIQFSGVNVQILDGAGKTETVNGEGNLVLGYDENPGKHAQTGSHDLILGEEQAFSSFGGIAAGYGNSISGREASITGGNRNIASGFYTSVSGGVLNTASVEAAWVGGGTGNTASGRFASIFGGHALTASGEFEAIP